MNKLSINAVLLIAALAAFAGQADAADLPPPLQSSMERILCRCQHRLRLERQRRWSVSLGVPPAPVGAAETTTVSSSLNWLATIRGRVGFTPIDRLLIFGTGGVAFGRVNNQLSIVASSPGFLATFNGSQQSTRTGWAAGAGAQYAITNDVFARVE